MAITRPDKPPLVGAPPQAAPPPPRVVVPVDVQTGQPAGPAYTMEDMPIDVMTTAPAQPPMPVVNDVVHLPNDPAVPAGPGMSGPPRENMRGSGGPAMVAGPDNTAAVVMPQDPATMPIDNPMPATRTQPTETPPIDLIDESESEDEGGGIGGGAIAALVAAGVVTAAQLRRMARTGTTGDPQVDQEVRNAREQVRTGTRGRTNNAGTGGDASGQTPDTGGTQGTRARRTANRAAPVTEATEQPAAPDTGPAASPDEAPVTTDDVMSGVTDGRPNMTPIDGTPPGLPQDHTGSVFTTTNSRDRTITTYVSDGSKWYALDTVRATPQGLRGDRTATMEALRALRSAVR